jgi:hypothetical protein
VARLASALLEQLRLRGGTRALVDAGLIGLAVLGLAGCITSATQSSSSTASAARTPSTMRTAAADSGPASATSVARVRLLSQDQYFNSIGYIFGPDITLAAHFAPFRRTQGLLEIGASSAGVTTGQIEEFQRTAAALADQVVSPQHRGFLVPCAPKDPKRADAKCATEFLSAVGRLLYRRPLTPAELTEIVTKANDGADHLKDFYAGLSSALEGMLISPDFLFVVDTTEPDPQHPGETRLDGYSLASRLSLFLWNATPDDELLKEAERGDLNSPVGRARVVDRMLASPRLEAGVRAFFDDMLSFDDFATLSKDPQIYPAFTGVTVQDAREQTLRTIVNHLLVKKGDYRDLFTTRDTFISPSLAAIYRVPAPPGWSEYDFPPNSARVGLLTEASFLSAHAHPGRSSPTRRGKALRELFLCQIVPRPPPNVDFSKVENPDPTLKTMRQRLSAHRSNPVCAGCHRITDPIGLSLENFDGAGEFRQTENGAPIDASGSLDGKSFTSPEGLAQALHDDPQVPACLVQRLYGYAVGGLEKSDSQVMLPYLDKRFAEEGYRLPDLMRTIALSNAFTEVNSSPAANPTSTATAEHVQRAPGAAAK